MSENEYTEDDFSNAAASSAEEMAFKQMLNGGIDITQGEYNKHLITPDRSRTIDSDGAATNTDAISRKWFTKELKISNLKRDEEDYIVNISDVGLQLDRMLSRCNEYVPNKKYFSDHLLDLRDLILSSSSSVGAKERELQVTSRNIAEIKKDGISKGLFTGNKNR